MSDKQTITKLSEGASGSPEETKEHNSISPKDDGKDITVAVSPRDAEDKSSQLTTRQEEIQKAKDLAKAVDTFLLGKENYQKLSPEQIEVCKQTAILFGLNPLKREIHFVPRKSTDGEYGVTVVIGYEVYIKRAEGTGRLDGWDVTLEGKGEDMKAVITIYKKGWSRPFKHEVYLVEARQSGPLWSKQPRFQLKKTAISQGFKLAFPEELGGLPYIPEELGIGSVEDGVIEVQQEPKITAAQLDTLRSLLRLKGKSEDPILSYYKISDLKDLTQAQAKGTISKLNTYPDKEEEEEIVDIDEIDKALEAKKAGKEVGEDK